VRSRESPAYLTQHLERFLVEDAEATSPVTGPVVHIINRRLTAVSARRSEKAARVKVVWESVSAPLTEPRERLVRCACSRSHDLTDCPAIPATSGIYDGWYHCIAVSRLQMVARFPLAEASGAREDCQKSLRVVS